MKKKLINTASQAQACFKNDGINVEISQIKAAFFDGQFFFIADLPTGLNRNRYPCIAAMSEQEEKVQIRQVEEMFILDEYHHVHCSRTEWVYVEIDGGRDFALVTEVTRRELLKQKRGEKQSCANT